MSEGSKGQIALFQGMSEGSKGQSALFQGERVQRLYAATVKSITMKLVDAIGMRIFVQALLSPSVKAAVHR